ncbi:hypothetical protein DDB_G0286791 [Dictyostelium discoideum AX4]|uniref:Uncharacterized protein n=1 Tax=Dictyostelium discoideum TaxID=44689 RepID=Q54LL1_DICDI|nr:hypothetical protein DDB_G0286791 [Dictyostelium discoideum AX4]EAL64151.1 hypothetical protein DDB_G0286791 [Dictyostelium discoideum AX4]|eukprot:XP_637550.1 hypothetical protein DDB_G0286791 [Dictyostelium discoideum AX4]
MIKYIFPFFLILTFYFLKLNGELITLQINANGNNVYKSGDQCGNSTFTYDGIYKIENQLILFEYNIEISPLNLNSKNVTIDGTSIYNNNNNNIKTFITISPPTGNIVESYKSHSIFKINGINFNNFTFTIIYIYKTYLNVVGSFENCNFNNFKSEFPMFYLINNNNNNIISNLYYNINSSFALTNCSMISNSNIGYNSSIINSKKFSVLIYRSKFQSINECNNFGYFYDSSRLTIYNSSINNNNCKIIFNINKINKLDVFNTKFENNNGTIFNIKFNSNEGLISIKNSSFINNYGGSIINLESNNNIPFENLKKNPQLFRDSTFFNNSFNGNGSIINSIGAYFIVSGEFENNKALNHQGDLFYLQDSYCLIEDSKINQVNNLPSGKGSIIYLQKSELEISSGNFKLDGSLK